MTGVPVGKAGQMMPYTADTVNKVPSGGTGFGDSFKAALNSRTGNNQPNQDFDVASRKSDKQTADANKVSKNDKTSRRDDMSKADNKVKTPKKDEKTVNEEREDISEETVETVAEQIAQVVNEVAEKMNVPEEVVIEAIDELGLEITDLLDATKMADIIAQISGAEDTISLVMDEDLYGKLGELQEFVEESNNNLMEELDLSQEALDEILKQSEALLEKRMNNENAVDLEESQKESGTAIEGLKDYKTKEIIDGKEVTTSVKVDNESGSENAQVRISQVSQGSGGNPSKEKSADDNMSDSKDNNGLVFSQEVQKNIEMPVEDSFSKEISSFDTEAGRIANQIMENMKANLKSDVTQLEMNLHPASLGSVRVNLTAANGQVTAQFLAQNETVKAAIESQITQLSNQFEEQGIKVESIEVAVADHKFEHEGGQNSADNPNSDEKNKPRTGRIRRIDMSAFDDDMNLDELDDSDRIAAEMMAQNGNKVDYTA